jgi:hypothetical protein
MTATTFYFDAIEKRLPKDDPTAFEHGETLLIALIHADGCVSQAEFDSFELARLYVMCRRGSQDVLVVHDARPAAEDHVTRESFQTLTNEDVWTGSGRTN